MIIPTKNDSDEELTEISKFIADELDSNIPWHISAFHPDYKEQNPTIYPQCCEILIKRDYFSVRQNSIVEGTHCPSCQH